MALGCIVHIQLVYYSYLLFIELIITQFKNQQLCHQHENHRQKDFSRIFFTLMNVIQIFYRINLPNSREKNDPPETEFVADYGYRIRVRSPNSCIEYTKFRNSSSKHECVCACVPACVCVSVV